MTGVSVNPELNLFPEKSSRIPTFKVLLEVLDKIFRFMANIGIRHISRKSPRKEFRFFYFSQLLNRNRELKSLK